jgi:hypothetical protein
MVSVDELFTTAWEGNHFSLPCRSAMLVLVIDEMWMRVFNKRLYRSLCQAKSGLECEQ